MVNPIKLTSLQLEAHESLSLQMQLQELQSLNIEELRTELIDVMTSLMIKDNLIRQAIKKDLTR